MESELSLAFIFFFLSSEMVAPLDVYHNTMGMAHNNNDNMGGGGGNGGEKKRHRHNRRHHNSQQRHHRSTGHMSGFDPNQAEVFIFLLFVFLSFFFNFLIYHLVCQINVTPCLLNYRFFPPGPCLDHPSPSFINFIGKSNF